MEVGWVGRNEKIPVRKKKCLFYFGIGRVIGRLEILGSLCMKSTKVFFF